MDGAGRPIPLVYLLALLGGALCIAQAAVVVRAFPPVHPVTMNAVGMTVGAALLLALSALRGDRWTLPEQAETRSRWPAWSSAVRLGRFCST